MFKRTYNDTMCFLKYLVDPEAKLGLNTGLINLYAGDARKDEKMGEHLVAHVYPSSVAWRELSTHPWKSSEERLDDGTVLVFLKPAPDAHERVVRPVVTGKFSEVDRDYVKTYYTRKKADGTLSVNWLILNRDPIMRALLEDWLNPTKYWGAYVRIPEDAEVASKPSYSREMFSPPS